jgi:hypothetical protein
MEDRRMSDQVYDDPESEDSHEADIDAGFDIADDDRTVPADLPTSDLDDDQPETSHDADVAAGYDDQAE